MLCRLLRRLLLLDLRTPPSKRVGPKLSSRVQLKPHSPSHFLLRLLLVSKLFRVITMTELFQTSKKVPICTRVNGQQFDGNERDWDIRLLPTYLLSFTVTSIALSFEPSKLNNSSQDSTLIFFCKSRPKACSRRETDLKPSTVCRKAHRGIIWGMKSQHNEGTYVDGRYKTEDVRFGLGTCSRTQYSSSTPGSSEAAKGVVVGCPLPLFLASAALVLALRRTSRDLKVALPDPVGLLSSTAEVDAVCGTRVARVRAERSA